MKANSLVLLATLALTPAAAFAAPQTYVCAMSDTSAAPYLTFLVTVFGEDDAQIRYVRSAFFGSEEVQFEQELPGCTRDDVAVASATTKALDVECAGDGDAGFLAVKLVGGALRGAMTFPNSGVEGYDDTSLSVGCRRQ